MVDPRQNVSEGDKDAMSGAGQTETAECSRSTGTKEAEGIQDIAEDHYAFYGGGDWHGIKKLKQRKKFDFTRAKKAITEANHSVIKNSR
ncbi:hypothetical protein Hanom_Chr09g00816721 [Helianthus anomalus]